MLKNLKNKGITLIALVITIIVLLILAGISISMLSGDNNILQRAGASKNSTEIAQEKENITLAYNSLIIDKKAENSSTIIESDFDKAIKNYDSSATATSERDKYIVTFSNGHKYTLYNSGKITEYSTTPYAVDELTVKVSGDTVESPYYVNYPSAKGTIKCRVLYNDCTYGLQIISVNPVTKVTLGKNDSSENVEGEMGSVERAQNSYMRAITTLNEKAEEYIRTIDESILATDARCIGSDPLNKNYPDNLTGAERTSEMFIADSSYTYMNDYNGKFFKSDAHANTDRTRLNKLYISGISDTTYGNYYWLASRLVNPPSSFLNLDAFQFVVWAVSSSGAYTSSSTWRVNSDGEPVAYNKELGLRPVFILSHNVKIIGGEGTEEVPFEIGL